MADQSITMHAACRSKADRQIFNIQAGLGPVGHGMAGMLDPLCAIVARRHNHTAASHLALPRPWLFFLPGLAVLLGRFLPLRA